MSIKRYLFALVPAKVIIVEIGICGIWRRSVADYVNQFVYIINTDPSLYWEPGAIGAELSNKEGLSGFPFVFVGELIPQIGNKHRLTLRYICYFWTWRFRAFHFRT